MGILMCHRPSSSHRYGNRWDFPGGHVEGGETPGEALARELFEEINVKISPPLTPPSFSVLASDDSPDGLSLDGWVLREWSGDVRNIALDEHDQIRWFTPNRALKLDLAHASYVELLHRLR
jgi:mutator protein MutT